MKVYYLLPHLPTARIIGIAFIVIYAIVGVMIGADYDGMNAPAFKNSKETNLDWLSIY